MQHQNSGFYSQDHNQQLQNYNQDYNQHLRRQNSLGQDFSEKTPSLEKKEETEKSITITESAMTQAVRIGAAGLGGIAIGYFLEEVVGSKSLSWLIAGSAVALAYETQIMIEKKH